MKTVVMYLVMEFMNTLEHMMGKLFTVTEHFERFIRSASEIHDLGYCRRIN